MVRKFGRRMKAQFLVCPACRSHYRCSVIHCRINRSDISYALLYSVEGFKPFIEQDINNDSTNFKK